MNDTKKFLTIVTISAAVGVVAGILFAPEEGAVLRRKIARLKNKMTCHAVEEDDEDVETLRDLKELLEKELSLIKAKLRKA